MKKINFTELFIFIVSAELVGAFSALVTGSSFSLIYQSLNKPPIAPPGWVFPVAWALLYALMGTAAYLVYDPTDEHAKKAMYFYIAQLFVNFLWSPVFFGLGWLAGGVMVAVLLLVAVILNVISFAKVSDTAALLLVPYLAWSAYALYLSIGFLVLN